MSCFRNLSSETEMGSRSSTCLNPTRKQNPSGKISSPASSAQVMATQSGNLVQNPVYENTSRNVENSTGLVEKKDDQKAESSGSLVLKEKEKKKIQQCEKNQPNKLSLERKYVKQKTQKVEKDAPKPGPNFHSNQPTRMETPTPIYHIRWDGLIEESREELGQKCCLCEIDLGVEPFEEEVYDEEIEYYQEFASYPEVAVLPCGHAFHQICLQLNTTEEKSRDPPCFICDSFTH